MLDTCSPLNLGPGRKGEGTLKWHVVEVLTDSDTTCRASVRGVEVVAVFFPCLRRTSDREENRREALLLLRRQGFLLKVSCSVAKRDRA